MDEFDLPQIIIILVISGIVLFVGTFVGSAVLEDGPDVASTERKQTAALLDGTSYTRISDATGTNETVFDSRGYAIELAGTDDSYFRSDTEIAIADDDTWTVSLWATRNASRDMTAISIGSSVVINYNQTRGNWTAWYYNESSRNSYSVDVDTQGTGDTFENVVLVRDGSTLTINANTTAGESVTLGGTNTEPVPEDANWEGRIEEVRLSDDAWNGTTSVSHYTAPIDPITGNNTGRIMFDEPYRSQQRFFYASGNIETSNATFETGVGGQELDADGLVLNGDYEWDTDGPRIRAVSGGELDGAPVAYVDYDREVSFGSGLVSGWESAMAFAGILLILLPLAVIVLRLRSTGR